MLETQDLTRQLEQREIESLRQQLAECKSKWEHFENSVAEKSMQCLSLEKELAECERERDEAYCDVEEADRRLATVTAERDELCKSLASAWYYGNWKAETANERYMQTLMENVGWWPVTEEQLIAATKLGAGKEETK